MPGFSVVAGEPSCERSVHEKRDADKKLDSCIWRFLFLGRAEVPELGFARGSCLRPNAIALRDRNHANIPSLRTTRPSNRLKVLKSA